METVDNIAQLHHHSSILGIFAKQPIPGQCKTRLCPPLSETESAAFYQCSLQETVVRMQQLTGCALAICYVGDRGWFEQQFPGLPLYPQKGADLGARMANALATFLSQGFSQAVLIGSDAPDLPLELVEQAFGELGPAEVVLSPAGDGGYVLIGESVHHPELFPEIKWSTAEVLPETQRRIAEHGIKSYELPGWDDIDDVHSLREFLNRSPQAATAGYLRQHLSKIL